MNLAYVIQRFTKMQKYLQIRQNRRNMGAKCVVNHKKQTLYDDSTAKISRYAVAGRGGGLEKVFQVRNRSQR